MSSTSSSRVELAGARRSDGRRRASRLLLRLLDEDLAVRPVPGRDAVAPPELARDAPGLDVLHPVEVGLLPVLRDDRGAPLAHAGDRRLGERLGVDVPLVGEERLDRHAAAVAVRDRVRVLVRLLDELALLHHRDDAVARREAVEPVERVDRLARARADGGTSVEKIRVAAQADVGLRVHDVDDRQIVPAADLEIVEVVRRRDLHRAGAGLRIGVFVGDDRDAAGRPAAGWRACRSGRGSARRRDAPRPPCRRASSPAASSRR